VRFATRSGVLTATAGDHGTYTLDFPTAPLTPIASDPALAQILGAEIISTHHTGPGTDDLLVELDSEATVRALTPDLTALARLERRGVVVTAAAAAASSDAVPTDAVPSGAGAAASAPAGPVAGHDFVSRFFGAAAGVPEDPVTGSAHTALAPFWSARLGGRTDLIGYQASARGGYVRVQLRGDRTLLTGAAVTVLDGELLA
jgi:predicted PhzF superfamily epimerase YddE/YHI9